MTQQIWVLDRGDEALPFCVQTIGKNGSTRLHKWLNHYEFTNARWDFVCNHDIYKHFPVYVFIQNPIDKFVKGFAELISNLRPAYAVGAINGLPPQITASPATEHIIFKEILTKMPTDAVDALLFQFLLRIDMYMHDYHLKLQTGVLAQLSSFNLNYEVLKTDDIDNFHNIVKQKHAQHFAERVDGHVNGLIPIDPERVEDSDRQLIEDRIHKVVDDHIDGELSVIREYLLPDLGLWDLLN
jgi:hypothetical protein